MTFSVNWPGGLSTGGSGRINLGDYFDTEDLWKKNWEGGNWMDRFGVSGSFDDSWGGGNWKDRWGTGTPKGLADSGDWLTKTSKWYNQLGGREFDEAWGGGAWWSDRAGKGDRQFSIAALLNIGAESSSSGGNGNDGGGGNGSNTIVDAEKLAKGFDLGSEQDETDRLARMRRMLAGRYGRAETNLTGGTGFGSGSQRTLGGYS